MNNTEVTQIGNDVYLIYLFTLDWMVNTPQREKSVTPRLLLSLSLPEELFSIGILSMIVCFSLLYNDFRFHSVFVLTGRRRAASPLYNDNATQLEWRVLSTDAPSSSLG